jgi:HSP20 family protein
MALMKWEPWAGLTTLQREMNRLFEAFADGDGRQSAAQITVPAVEISDTPEAVIVKAQVPGITKDQIQVMVTDGTLTLKGESKAEEEKKEKTYYRREFRYGAFTRTVPLPVAVQAEKATAQLKDGVLAITIPKSAQAREKTIPIQA